MNYSTFEAQLLQELEDETSTLWDSGDLLTWTNEGILDICRRTHCMNEIARRTVWATEERYPLPERFLVPMKLIVDNTEMERETVESLYLNLSTNPVDAGQPEKYALSASELFIRPIPDKDYTLVFVFYSYPAAITASDTIPFSGKIDELLRYYVKARANEQVGDWAYSAELRSRYDDALTTFLEESMQAEEAQTVTEPRTVW